MLLAKLLLAVCLQVTSDAPVVTFRGELGPGDPVVTTEALARTVAAEFPTRGQTLSFTPESSGPHRVELRSFSFKPYLVVRAPSGAVLGEDEYSLFGILPRVTVELEAGQTYRIDAGSRCGAPGAFTVDVFRGAAPVADQAADRAQALTYAREGLRELESRGTAPDSALGTALHRLAYASLFSGQVAEGIELFRRALAVREDALGAHPLTAETCLSLGGVLQQTGDAAGALPLLQRALAIDEQVFGPGHPVTAGAARNLASLYELRGEPQAAEPLYVRALGVLEPALGPDAKDVLFVRSRLALLLHKRGELDGAMALYESELATRERLNPGRDPESARVLESLAAIHEERGEPQAALGLLERALERREATVGPDHRDTAGTLAHLGVLLKALGETERGAGAIERAVAIDPDVYVPELVRQADEAHWWNDRTTRWWQLVWVGLGALLFAWSRRRALAGLAAPKPWLALAVLVSALTYVNFGAFQFGSFVHRWDSFHYYVGAKYFDELRYDGLYDCVLIADQETPGWSGRNATRVVRDLRTNQIVDAASVLAAPEPWKSRFTPERWSAFCADVASFRDRESAERWEQTTTDHGYNATPVWGILGGLLANAVPATDDGLVLLAALDQVYLAALVVALVWGFGWELAALAMVVFATFYPGRFAWTGGSLLRWDWLFFTVLAVAALRKQRPWLAGLALGYATLLRVFPVFVFAGPVLAWLAELVAARRDGRAPSHGLWPRFFGGALLSAAVLVPISFVTSGGVSAWSQFATNSAKHQETPLTNYLGLRTVLTWRADSPARTEESRDDQTFWDAWRTSRTRAWGEMR
ncbi:MAG: tetratricopeptide repeat protein, partial [Planctomycetes bacterium]|nr:tetratricopeptide repeat protein [Planctomycetota bacterium]